MENKIEELLPVCLSGSTIMAKLNLKGGNALLQFAIRHQHEL